MLVYERVSQPLTRTSLMRWATHRVIPAPGFIAPALPTVARSVSEGPLWFTKSSTTAIGCWCGSSAIRSASCPTDIPNIHSITELALTSRLGTR